MRHGALDKLALGGKAALALTANEERGNPILTHSLAHRRFNRGVAQGAGNAPGRMKSGIFDKGTMHIRRQTFGMLRMHRDALNRRAAFPINRIRLFPGTLAARTDPFRTRQTGIAISKHVHNHPAGMSEHIAHR